MKRQIRQSVFETNSSSTHSLTMCQAEDYRQWREGELLFNMSPDKNYPQFFSKEQGIQANIELLKKWEDITEEDLEAYKKGEKSLTDLVDDAYSYYMTYEEWDDWAEEQYETFYDRFADVVAFGYYGSDY